MMTFHTTEFSLNRKTRLTLRGKNRKRKINAKKHMRTDLIYCVNIRLKDFGTKFNLKGKSCFEGFHDFIDLIFTEQYALQF